MALATALGDQPAGGTAIALIVVVVRIKIWPPEYRFDDVVGGLPSVV